MIRRPPRSTQSRSSAASDVYKRQELGVGVVLDDQPRLAANAGLDVPADIEVRSQRRLADEFDVELALADHEYRLVFGAPAQLQTLADRDVAERVRVRPGQRLVEFVLV